MAISHTFKRLIGIKNNYQTSQIPTSNTSPSNDIEHINREMYKKSAELADRNKTLSLLQKINELILGTITDPDELAKQVTTVLVQDDDIKLVSIFLYDKSLLMLRRLARAEKSVSDEVVINTSQIGHISLRDTNNPLVQSVNERKIIFTSAIDHVLLEPPQDIKQVKSLFIAPLSVRNELIGAMVIALQDEEKDITEFRRDLLYRLVDTVGIGIDNAMLYNEVQDANRRLKELDLLKNEFVSVASHELRTPMTAIKSYLWMALQGKGGELNEKQKYYVERGYNSVDRLIRLVNDMLNISRIESGKITIEMQSVDLVQLTKEVVEEVLPRASELGIKIIVEEPITKLPKVVADSDKIKEVIINLIGNSLKFTPKDGSITIKFELKEGMVTTTIKDTGNGIEPEDIGKLFQKFGLLPGSYTTNQPAMGTGLGLYICREILDMHHGKIWAESEGKGKGATMTFTLREYSDQEKENLTTVKPGEQKEKMELIHSKF